MVLQYIWEVLGVPKVATGHTLSAGSSGHLYMQPMCRRTGHGQHKELLESQVQVAVGKVPRRRWF